MGLKCQGSLGYNKKAMLSKRVSHIKPAPTLALSAKVNQLKSQGFDVVGFGAGEPDFDTPDFIKEACMKALKEGKTKYSPSGGIPPLRQALAEKLLKENNVEYKPSEIVVTAGAKMALYLVFCAILDEGDEVLLPSPYWVTYPEQILLCGCKAGGGQTKGGKRVYPEGGGYRNHT